MALRTQWNGKRMYSPYHHGEIKLCNANYVYRRKCSSALVVKNASRFAGLISSNDKCVYFGISVYTREWNNVISMHRNHVLNYN